MSFVRPPVSPVFPGTIIKLKLNGLRRVVWIEIDVGKQNIVFSNDKRIRRAMKEMLN